MWVLVKAKNKIITRYYKRKLIKYYVFIIVNKIKGNQVEVIDWRLK